MAQSFSAKIFESQSSLSMTIFGMELSLESKRSIVSPSSSNAVDKVGSENMSLVGGKSAAAIITAADIRLRNMSCMEKTDF